MGLGRLGRQGSKQESPVKGPRARIGFMSEGTQRIVTGWIEGRMRGRRGADLEPAWMYWAKSPSAAILPAFLSAAAKPFLRRACTAQTRQNCPAPPQLSLGKAANSDTEIMCRPTLTSTHHTYHIDHWSATGRLEIFEVKVSTTGKVVLCCASTGCKQSTCSWDRAVGQGSAANWKFQGDEQADGPRPQGRTVAHCTLFCSTETVHSNYNTLKASLQICSV